MFKFKDEKFIDEERASHGFPVEITENSSEKIIRYSLRNKLISFEELPEKFKTAKFCKELLARDTQVYPLLPDELRGNLEILKYLQRIGELEYIMNIPSEYITLELIKELFPIGKKNRDIDDLSIFLDNQSFKINNNELKEYCFQYAERYNQRSDFEICEDILTEDDVIRIAKNGSILLYTIPDKFRNISFYKKVFKYLNYSMLKIIPDNYLIEVSGDPSEIRDSSIKYYVLIKSPKENITLEWLKDLISDSSKSINLKDLIVYNPSIMGYLYNKYHDNLESKELDILNKFFSKSITTIFPQILKKYQTQELTQLFIATITSDEEVEITLPKTLILTINPQYLTENIMLELMKKDISVYDLIANPTPAMSLFYENMK